VHFSSNDIFAFHQGQIVQRHRYRFAVLQCITCLGAVGYGAARHVVSGYFLAVQIKHNAIVDSEFYGTGFCEARQVVNTELLSEVCCGIFAGG